MTLVHRIDTLGIPFGATAVSPDGRFVYIAAPDDRKVLVFARDVVGGGLTELATTVTVEGATTLVLSPDGRSLYAGADTTPGQVVAFSRDVVTGALTQMACFEPGAENGCTAVRGLHGPTDVAVSGDGASVYVTSGLNGQAGVVAFARDTSTGALSQLAGADGCLNESNASCTDTDTLINAHAIVVSGDGRFAYAASFDGALVTLRRDTATGALAELAHPDGCLQAPQFPGSPCTAARAIWQTNDLLLSPDGRNAYAAAGMRGLSAFRRTPPEVIVDPPLPPEEPTIQPEQPAPPLTLTPTTPSSVPSVPVVVIETPHAGDEPEVVAPTLKLIAKTDARGLRSGRLSVVVRCDRACNATVAAYAKVKGKLHRLAGKRVKLKKKGDLVVNMRVTGKSLKLLNTRGTSLVFRARAD